MILKMTIMMIFPEDEEPFVLSQETLQEVVEPGAFIGMGSPPNSIKPFPVITKLKLQLKLNFKVITIKNISNNYEHSILAGEHHAGVLYL